MTPGAKRPPVATGAESNDKKLTKNSGPDDTSQPLWLERLVDAKARIESVSSLVAWNLFVDPNYVMETSLVSAILGTLERVAIDIERTAIELTAAA